MQESAYRNAPTITIGEIVAADFRTAKVFEKNGIDFCCGGDVALAATCSNKGIDLATITKELEEMQNEPAERSQNYSSWALPFLIDYIVNTHHLYLKENDWQIAAYARKIAGIHGAHHHEVIHIATIFDKITTDMAAQLKRRRGGFLSSRQAGQGGQDSRVFAGYGGSGNNSGVVAQTSSRTRGDWRCSPHDPSSFKGLRDTW